MNRSNKENINTRKEKESTPESAIQEQIEENIKLNFNPLFNLSNVEYLNRVGKDSCTIATMQTITNTQQQVQNGQLPPIISLNDILVITKDAFFFDTLTHCLTCITSFYNSNSKLPSQFITTNTLYNYKTDKNEDVFTIFFLKYNANYIFSETLDCNTNDIVINFFSFSDYVLSISNDINKIINDYNKKLPVDTNYCFVFSLKEGNNLISVNEIYNELLTKMENYLNIHPNTYFFIYSDIPIKFTGSNDILKRIVDIRILNINTNNSLQNNQNNVINILSSINSYVIRNYDILLITDESIKLWVNLFKQSHQFKKCKTNSLSVNSNLLNPDCATCSNSNNNNNNSNSSNCNSCN